MLEILTAIPAPTPTPTTPIRTPLLIPNRNQLLHRSPNRLPHLSLNLPRHPNLLRHRSLSLLPHRNPNRNRLPHLLQNRNPHLLQNRNLLRHLHLSRPQLLQLPHPPTTSTTGNKFKSTDIKKLRKCGAFFV